MGTMRHALVLALVALVGCDSGQVAPMGGGLGGLGGGPADGDGGDLVLDAQLAGFVDSGRDAQADGASMLDAFVPDSSAMLDAGQDAGPCYPPEGLDTSLPLECDVCPGNECLPVIWTGSMASGTVSGEPGIVAATATIETEMYSLRVRLEPSDEPQARVIYEGEFFEHLHQGQPIMLGKEFELDREPWTESYVGPPRPANTAVPNYIRLVAIVTNASASFTWTMHRAPD